MTLRYEELVARNAGYVDDATQHRIGAQRLLIAGCGIGSSLAVCATRMGFRHFLLVDGDTVDTHNLNRQFYDAADVGRLKVEALRDQILRINPEADVQVVAENLDDRNTDRIVAAADIVFDTVDFLDLKAILRLHESAHTHKKPVFTALSAGFGALVWYFPADGHVTLPRLLLRDVEAAGGAEASYADVFAGFVQRIARHLDAEVVEQIARVLTLLKEGRPCPAPQVAVGSFAIAAMAMSMIHDMLAGRELPAAPALLIHSFRQHRSTIVNVLDD